MKKIALLSIMINLFTLLKGQVLDKRYNSFTTSYYKFSDTEEGYADFNNTLKTVFVYNASHNLIHTTQFTFTGTLYLVSKTIINNDGTYKYVISHDNKISIFDENKNELFSRDSASIAKFIKTMSGPKMILLSTSGGWQEFYSMPGLVLAAVANPKPSHSIDVSIYPNPTDSKIVLSTNSSLNTTIQLNIIDLNGKTIKNENLKLINGQVEFDSSSIKKGQYLIQIVSDEFSTAVKHIIID